MHVLHMEVNVKTNKYVTNFFNIGNVSNSEKVHLVYSGSFINCTVYTASIE
jgi:hypothetical protein